MGAGDFYSELSVMGRREEQNVALENEICPPVLAACSPGVWPAVGTARMSLNVAGVC